MNRKQFWQGVMLWVKLFFTLAVGFFLMLTIPALGFDTSDNFKYPLRAVTIMIVACSMVYLIFMSTSRTLRVKRQGFWVAALLTIVAGILTGIVFYPLVGFAFSLFCAVCCWKLASSRASCECD